MNRPLIRLALPKGRAQKVVLAALAAGGGAFAGLDPQDRRLRVTLPEEGLELLFLKGWDVPRYVENGVADAGFVGSDVLDEHGCDLLVPLRLKEGRCRISLVGFPGTLPAAGGQVRLATKYPATARRVVAKRPWGAEVLELSGSIELAPILGLADLALDIVETGRTLKDNGLVELEPVAEVRPCLVVNRSSFLAHRFRINDLADRLESAGVAA
ncbi:MAG: ATP phosphoribosyltransferase [Acidobacteriota bacterium]